MWETKKKIPANNILFSRRWTRKITNRTQFAAKVTHVQDEFGIAKGSVDIPILYCMRRLSPHASYCRHPLKIPPQKKKQAGPLSPSGISEGSEACGSSGDPFFQRIQQNSGWDDFGKDDIVHIIVRMKKCYTVRWDNNSSFCLYKRRWHMMGFSKKILPILSKSTYSWNLLALDLLKGT